MTNELKVLETLTDTAIDSAESYETAADLAKTPGLATMLRDQGAKRCLLVDSLNGEIERLGGSARTSGSTMGAVHRAWTAISGRPRLRLQLMEQMQYNLLFRWFVGLRRCSRRIATDC